MMEFARAHRGFALLFSCCFPVFSQTRGFPYALMFEESLGLDLHLSRLCLASGLKHTALACWGAHTESSARVLVAVPTLMLLGAYSLQPPDSRNKVVRSAPMRSFCFVFLEFGARASCSEQFRGRSICQCDQKSRLCG